MRNVRDLDKLKNRQRAFHVHIDLFPFMDTCVCVCMYVCMYVNDSIVSSFSINEEYDL
jgi:hypothetical protein